MKNPAVIIISSILSIILLLAEIIFLVQFNLSRGIKQKTVLEIIDNADIREEFEQSEDYNEIRKINPEIAEKIIESDELEKYTKENIKSLYLNLFYNQKNEYIKGDKLKEFINNTLENSEITEEEKAQLSDKTETIIYETDDAIETIQNEKLVTSIIKSILSKTTSYILLIGIMLVVLILIAVNKLKEALIWIGIPTTMSGILFFMLSNELKTDITSTIYKKLVNEISSTLRTSSMITITIGLALIVTYTIKKYQKESEFNGEI